MSTVSQSVDHIRKLVLANEPVSFFCGAGISKASPSSALLWGEFRNLILNSITDNLKDYKLISKKESNSINRMFVDFESTNNLWIKPELALHWVWMRFGDRLFDSFNVLNKGSYNRNHVILANLSSRYNVMIATCNFDTYIEEALATINKQPNIYASNKKIRSIKSFHSYVKYFSSFNRNAIPILKVHGTLEEPTTIKATLTQVSKKINQTLHNSLRKIIHKRHLVVIGYSGNDHDLMPSIQKLSKSAKSITWIARDRSSKIPELHPKVKNLDIVYCNLNTYMNKLGKSINLSIRVRRKNKVEENYSFFNFINNEEEIYDSAISLALLGVNIGQFELTKLLCNKIITICNTQDPNHIRALNLLGIINKRANPTLSKQYYVKAINYCKKLREEHQSLYANLLGNYAALLFEMGQFKTAIKSLEESTDWIKRTNNYTVLAQNYDDLGNIYKSLGKTKIALDYHIKAEKILRKEGELVALGRVLNNKGSALAELRMYQKAMKSYTESLIIKEKETSDKGTLARGYMNKAELHILLKEYKEAIKELDKSIKLSEEVTDMICKARSMYNKGFAYLMLKNNTQSIKWYRKAEQNSKTIPNWNKDPNRKKWINTIQESFKKKTSS